MFIETALKNIALNTIMSEIDSSSIYDMYDKAISSYKNAPAGTREDIKKKYQNNKLNLQGSIQNAIAAAYRKENPKITHFYNNVNYNEVPLWAIFEILTMGDFGYLLSCLTIDMREKVSRAIGINLSSDTYRELLYNYVYLSLIHILTLPTNREVWMSVVGALHKKKRRLIQICGS